MLRVLVMVSGGGTNFQAIIDGVNNKTITNAEIVGVISNNYGVYSLERAEKALEDNKTLTDKEPELLASTKKQKAQDIKANKKIAKTV